jgi:hypothetical protein
VGLALVRGDGPCQSWLGHMVHRDWEERPSRLAMMTPSHLFDVVANVRSMGISMQGMQCR